MTAKEGYKEDEEEMELRKGPWTIDEDTLLIHYITCHGEGRWNLLAKRSGLRRTGKSCRLRWLNYLKPDVKRGNLSPEEQILILDLHSKGLFGCRVGQGWSNPGYYSQGWSRIAQHLPGRTDNEIKNYWRTRVQKQAKQLKIDANSVMFRDIVRCFWMPRLMQSMSSSQTLVSSPILRPNPPTQAQDEQVIFPSLVQSQALLDGISTSNYDMVQQPQDHGSQLATCGSCEQLVSYGFGRVPVPLDQMGNIGAGDLDASDSSMMLEVEGGLAVQSPWDSMDELWQLMTATSIGD